MKIAIVGTGNVAKRNYLPVLAEQDDVELHCYNRTASKAADVAEEFGGRAAADMEDLMAQEPDAVLVLTGETQRYEATQAVLAHSPKRLFFEKPLVAAQGQANVTVEDFFQGRELLAAADAAGCETAMVFNYRFFDQTLLARKIVKERGFGRVLNFTGLVHYCTWSHCIDLLHHFAGPVADVTALCGKTAYLFGEDEATDVTAAFVTADGATGTILGTQAPPVKFPLYELTLNFENGRLHMRDLDGTMEVLDYRRPFHEVHAMTRDTSRWDQYRASFRKSIEAYLESIRNGEPPPVPGVAGLRELQFEAGLKRSAAEGRPVNLTEEFPLS